MEEKIIIKGDFLKSNIVSIICFGLAAIALVLTPILGFSMHSDDNFFDTYIAPRAGEGSAVVFYLTFIFAGLGLFFYFFFNKCDITVTDKRVFGKTAFGKTVDLPLDKVSSVGTSFPKAITVATSSGIIRFFLLSNQSNVLNAISNLLIARQSNKVTEIKPTESSADELKKYKELLDNGTITEEEFNAKKKQLLGL